MTFPRDHLVTLSSCQSEMMLSQNFQFSQASLADYVDCPRRFQLRYLLEQEWPAVESEPLLERERLAEIGRRFHKLIQQHIEGLPVEVLTRSLGDAELVRWWRSYLIGLDTTLIDLPTDRRAEVAMSIPLAGYRLTAHFDLVAAGADRAVIVDWKTERRKPMREQLLNRMQTRVYRYVLTEAQHRLPGSVSMIYWFAEFPDQPEMLPYDTSQHAADHQFLTELISEIQNRTLQDQAEWNLTPQERKCDFCPYRSLCNRGIGAGVIDPDSDDLDREFEIKLEAIDEIEY